MIEQGNILITGANSGLGKYCCELFNGVGYTRQSNYNALMQQAQTNPFRAIIHSAFNPKNDVKTPELYHYLNDTTLLTKKLLALPHQTFIFISSTDVYPKNDNLHHEDDVISIKDVHSMYGISKLLSESLIQNEAKNYLILRPTALLGRYARPNSLIKILTLKNPTLTLAGNSTFNYIRHADITEFIKLALAKNLQGIYNIAASSNIQLTEVKNHFNRAVQFGEYTYTTGNINNQKVTSVLNNFTKNSLENIILFMKEMNVNC